MSRSSRTIFTPARVPMLLLSGVLLAGPGLGTAEPVERAHDSGIPGAPAAAAVEPASRQPVNTLVTQAVSRERAEPDTPTVADELARPVPVAVTLIGLVLLIVGGVTLYRRGRH